MWVMKLRAGYSCIEVATVQEDISMDCLLVVDYIPFREFEHIGIPCVVVYIMEGLLIKNLAEKQRWNFS